MSSPNTFRAGPDERGLFGMFGGRYVAETLMPLVLEVERAYDVARRDPEFARAIGYYFEHYVGRPSPLYLAQRLTDQCGGAKVYLKREDLNHTGAHKINNTIGQILLAQRMGKRRIIAETGAGQHGVATATVCALFNLPCVVYMGATDIERQAPNVFRMKLLGAEVRSVTSGTATLKDAMNEALRDWVSNVEDTYYLIGTVAGRIPIRRWCAISRTSSATKRGGRCTRPKAGCPIRLSRALAAAPTRWGCSIPSSTIRASR